MAGKLHYKSAMERLQVALVQSQEALIRDGRRVVVVLEGRDAAGKDGVIRRIKFRDSFRPFGASVLEEDTALYFEGKNPVSPYMTVTYRVRDASREALAGVTHHDGTCRIQTVNEAQNPLYYRLLLNLKQKTGRGVCLNTSFNLNHEPIVCTPQQALSSFYGSGLDALFIGNYIVNK